MAFFFHGKILLGSELRSRVSLALAGFEARVRLVNDVDAALAAHNLAVGVTILERFDGRGDFHGNAGPEFGGKRVIKPNRLAGVNGK
jgi:hypothetical protein